MHAIENEFHTNKQLFNHLVFNYIIYSNMFYKINIKKYIFSDSTVLLKLFKQIVKNFQKKKEYIINKSRARHNIWH